jgi:hypothetical protein
MNSFFSGKLLKLLYIFTLVLILLLVGCGNYENDNSSPICTGDPNCRDLKRTDMGPELIDFVGTYELERFMIIDETSNVSVDESDFESWCGKMVITYEGMIMYDQVFGNNSGSYEWEILEIVKGAFKVREGTCEAWVDYILMGDELMIIWPDGPCMEGFTMTLSTIRTSYLDVYPTESCPLPQEPITPQIQDYVGTYILEGFSYVYIEDGMTISQDDAASWSGQMVTTSDGVIDFTLTMNMEDYHSIWKILEVDNEINQFLVRDTGSCEEWIDFNYDREEDFLALMWSGDGCTNGVAMTFLFTKIGDSSVSLNRFLHRVMLKNV